MKHLNRLVILFVNKTILKHEENVDVYHTIHSTAWLELLPITETWGTIVSARCGKDLGRDGKGHSRSMQLVCRYLAVTVEEQHYSCRSGFYSCTNTGSSMWASVHLHTSAHFKSDGHRLLWIRIRCVGAVCYHFCACNNLRTVERIFV
jgi:hypothetical protein